MPPGLSCEILDHDAGKDDELSIDAVENTMVGEVQAVCNFD